MARVTRPAGGWNWPGGYGSEPPPEIQAAIRAEAARVRAEGLARMQSGQNLNGYRPGCGRLTSGPGNHVPTATGSAKREAILAEAESIAALGEEPRPADIARNLGLDRRLVHYHRDKLIGAGRWPSSR